MDEQIIASLCGGDVKSAAAVLERLIHLVSQILKLTSKTSLFRLFYNTCLMLYLFYFRILIDLVFQN